MFEVEENMVVFAFRYALGRKTYAVKEVSDYLIDNWHRFSPHTKDQIVRDIDRAIEINEAGHECDINAWKRIILLESACERL